MFGIVGAGTIGTLVAAGLEKSGLYQCVGVHTRSRASYERFCRYIPCDFLSLEELALRCSLIFLTTPDDSIAQIAQKIQQACPGTPEPSGKPISSDKPISSGTPAFFGVRTLIHCSGALPCRVMDFDCPQEAPPWRYAGVHPYRAFASIASGLGSMRGTHFGVEGSDEEAVMCGEAIVRALGGVVHRVPEEGKTLYHGAAVIASNYLVTLTSMGVDLLEGIGLTGEESLQLLLPLMQGTLDNLKAGGLMVLTGPIVRGDAEVVRRHLAQLPEGIREVYCALGLRTLELGRRQKERAGRPYAAGVETELRNLLGGRA
jgi:predicted short-subunit dehydrogenase-like oxidoreductase (DUF2520 family)